MATKFRTVRFEIKRLLKVKFKVIHVGHFLSDKSRTGYALLLNTIMGSKHHSVKAHYNVVSSPVQ